MASEGPSRDSARSGPGELSTLTRPGGPGGPQCPPSAASSATDVGAPQRAASPPSPGSSCRAPRCPAWPAPRRGLHRAECEQPARPTRAEDALWAPPPSGSEGQGLGKRGWGQAIYLLILRPPAPSTCPLHAGRPAGRRGADPEGQEADQRRGNTAQGAAPRWQRSPRPGQITSPWGPHERRGSPPGTGSRRPPLLPARGGGLPDQWLPAAAPNAFLSSFSSGSSPFSPGPSSALFLAERSERGAGKTDTRRVNLRALTARRAITINLTNANLMGGGICLPRAV